MTSSSVYRGHVSSWRRSPAVAVIVSSVFLIVQLGLPLSQLNSDLASRYGWQMFSTTRAIPEFVVKTSSELVEITLNDYMARVRADIDIVDELPPHLCQVVPGAQSVTWDEGEYRC